ncbi:lectin-like domain-containing protein [Ferruginibacter sp.]
MRVQLTINYFLLFFFSCCSQILFAQQYTVNGSATQTACNAYTLTPAAGGQSGSVWNNNKINLTQSFDFKFDVWLGSPQPGGAGADGIAFVLQPISTSVGSSGNGMGYSGITPAVGVTIDTYQNSSPDNDPSYDHIAIQLNGDINHNSANNIAGPVTAVNGSNDIEDAAWHTMRVQWDAATTTLSIYIDGSLRVSAVRDLVNTVFAGNPMVYWGFTGSTGGEFNLQRFKTALSPAFNFSTTQKKCVNEPITFLDATVAFSTIAKFYWDFGDGSPIDSVNLNPVHTYTTAGLYTVIQRVIGADGCEATNTQTITIGSKPIASFTTNGNCMFRPQNNPLAFTSTSTVTVGTLQSYYWDLDNNGQTGTTFSVPVIYTTPGDKFIKHVVKSQEGCESDTLYKVVHIYGPPIPDFTFTDSVCLGQPTLFSGNAVPAVGDTATVTWNWQIDNNIVYNTLNPTYTYLTPGSHGVSLFAYPLYVSPGPGGCTGIQTKAVFVVNKPTANFNYGTICQATSVTLTDASTTTDGVPINQWWWTLGASGGISNQQNPSTVFNTATGNDTVLLVVHNAKGCASDTLKKPIVINSKPTANFGYSTPVCNGLPVQFSDSSKVNGGTVTQWSWVYNGTQFSTAQNPSNTFTAGSQTVKLVATSNLGCVSDTASKTFYVNPSPSVSINFKDACKFALVDFSAVDNSATVTQWKWVFGDGGTALTQNAQHMYTANGAYKVKLYATASNGCYSDSLEKTINIYGTNAFAGNDTIAAAGQPVQLSASGGLSYSWTPAYLLSDPTIPNPVTILTSTQVFTLKASTPEGCESYDDVEVKIYKGPDIYLPTAFTPNGDGLNDDFKGTPVGIKQFNYLKVFNRWGQLIFSSSDYNKAWDGKWKGDKQPGGVYVVMANGIDFKGNTIEKKQTVMLIR